LQDLRIFTIYAPPVNGPIISVRKLRRIEWTGHAARMEGKQKYIEGFLGKPLGKRAA
jgi:hypothetical protein